MRAAESTHDTLPLIACDMCAAIHRRQPLQADETASCSRCGAALWRHSRLAPAGWLAIALTALIMFWIANAYPIAAMSVQGRVQQATLFQALVLTWQQGRPGVALMSGLTACVLPLLQILLLTWVLAGLAQARRVPGFALALRWLGLLRPWCMVPVFVLGIVVAVVKLAGMAAVAPAPGLIGYAVLTVLLTMLGRLSPHVLWRMAETAGACPTTLGEPPVGAVRTGCHVCGQVQSLPLTADVVHSCVRCAAPVHLRKPDHIARTWALLIAATLLYIPANILPVMNVGSVLGNSSHTILGGVIQLWGMGSWDLAVIVFIASVAVPMTKLLALATLLILLQRGSTNNLPQRTRMYQMVEFIGQWSMLDVYVVILLAALANFQGLMTVSAGGGATAFGLVVVLTMLAAMSFDPRRAWDLAAQDQEAPSDDAATPSKP